MKDHGMIEKMDQIILDAQKRIDADMKIIRQAKVYRAAAEGRDLSGAQWGFGLKPPEGWICDGAGSFERIDELGGLVGHEVARFWAALLFDPATAMEWIGVGVEDPLTAKELERRGIHPKDSAAALAKSIN